MGAVPQVTYAAPQVVTHAVASAAVPASTELLTKTVVAAPAVQYVAAPHYGYAPLAGVPFLGPSLLLLLLLPLLLRLPLLWSLLKMEQRQDKEVQKQYDIL